MKNSKTLSENKIIYKNYLVLLVLIFVTFLVYFNSLKNNWTNWDDNIYVTENPLIKNLTLKSIIKIFTSFYSANYHPLTILTYAFEYKIAGLNPLIYHLTNLILHILNCILIYLIFSLISCSRTTGFITAVFFAVHPVHVESVAWISERKDVLYAFFYLLSILFYLKYLKEEKKKYFNYVVLFFILSLISKPMSVTLPFVLFLFDYILKRKFNSMVVLEKIPLILLSFVGSILTLLAQHYWGAVRIAEVFNIFDNIKNASSCIMFYVYKIFIPFKLSCFYPSLSSDKTFIGKILSFSPLFLIVTGVIVIWTAKWTRKIIFGSLFFIITVLPVLHIIPVGEAIPADRYIYIPSAGIFYIFAEFFIFLSKKEYFKDIVYLILLVIFFILSVLTYNRTKVWKNSFTLWNDVIRKYPEIATAYLNLGLAWGDAGDYEKALECYHMTVKLEPNSADAYNNTGNIYYWKKDYEKALQAYSTAIRIYSEMGVKNKNISRAYNNRGSIYFLMARFEDALSDFNRAIEIDPQYPDAYYNRGNLYMKNGKIYEAKEDFKKVIMLNPSDFQAIQKYNVLSSLEQELLKKRKNEENK